MVLRQEFNEIVPVYPVMTFRKSERCQSPFFNPAQYRYRADPAVLGNETGSNISGTPVFFSFLQINPPVSVLRNLIILEYLRYLEYLISLVVFIYLLYATRITVAS